MITHTAVLNAVSHLTGVDDFKKRKGLTAKNHSTTRERKAAAILLRDLCDASYPTIAHLLGYEDHTSSMYAVKTWQRDHRTVEIVKAVRKMLLPAEVA